MVPLALASAPPVAAQSPSAECLFEPFPDTPIAIPMEEVKKERNIDAEKIADAIEKGCEIIVRFANIYGLLDLSGMRVRERLDLSDSSLMGRFDGTTFQKDVDFTGVTFKRYVRPIDLNEVEFTNATFQGRADFTGATFEEDVYFQGTTFEETAVFSNSTFRKAVRFDGARFSATAFFDKATFEKAVTFGVTEGLFGAATFDEIAIFAGAKFRERTDFVGVSFRDRVILSSAGFEGESDFSGATFMGDAGFTGDRFVGDVSFGHSVFQDTASFSGSLFEARVSFEDTLFNDEVFFNNADVGRAWFIGTKFESFVHPPAQVMNLVGLNWDQIKDTIPATEKLDLMGQWENLFASGGLHSQASEVRTARRHDQLKPIWVSLSISFGSTVALFWLLYSGYWWYFQRNESPTPQPQSTWRRALWLAKVFLFSLDVNTPGISAWKYDWQTRGGLGLDRGPVPILTAVQGLFGWVTFGLGAAVMVAFVIS